MGKRQVLVIFDCDGVLIDSEVIACSADAEALSEAGYDITWERVVERFAGVPDEAMYATVEAELGHSLPKDFQTLVKKRVLEKYRTELKAIKGVEEVLSSMTERKCVASSSSPAKLALGLIETGLFELLYPHVFSTALVARGKPHPDLFLYSAEMMGVEPSDCIVVEDSAAGVRAARAAGMRPIGFDGGSHCLPNHTEHLVQAGAELVISDMRLLFEVIR